MYSQAPVGPEERGGGAGPEGGEEGPAAAAPPGAEQGRTSPSLPDLLCLDHGEIK